MVEFLAGSAVVLAFVAIVGVLSLAREVGLLRAARSTEVPRDLGVVGARVQGASTETLTGAVVDTPAQQGRALYLFVLQGCEPCDTLLAELGGRGSRSATPDLFLVVRGDRAAAAALATRGSVEHAQVLLDPDGSLGTRFSVTAFPSAVALADGRITATRMVGSLADLERVGSAAAPATSPRSTTEHQHPRVSGTTGAGGV